MRSLIWSHEIFSKQPAWHVPFPHAHVTRAQLPDKNLLSVCHRLRNHNGSINMPRCSAGCAAQTNSEVVRLQIPVNKILQSHVTWHHRRSSMRKLRIVESPTCVASIHGIILLSNPKKVSRGKPYTFHVPLLNTHTQCSFECRYSSLLIICSASMMVVLTENFLWQLLKRSWHLKSLSGWTGELVEWETSCQNLHIQLYQSTFDTFGMKSAWEGVPAFLHLQYM